MSIRRFALGAATGLLLAVSPAVADDAMVIVPGSSVGPIAAYTTEAELAGQLPPGQVKRVLYSLGEGAYGCGTEVFSGTDDKVIVNWSNETGEYDTDKAEDWAACRGRQGLAYPVNVTIDTAEGHWRTPDGFRVGMTVSDIARIIGKPVSVSVCPCDYGGFLDSTDASFIDAVSIWTSFPQNADYIFAKFIDPQADYLLSTKDIPPEMENGFVVWRMDIAINAAPPR